MAAVHRAAAVGFQRSADLYERARPDYADEAIAWLGKRLALGPGVNVLDLAAGTGKLTRRLIGTGARGPAGGLAARIGSISFIAALDDAERLPLLGRVRALAGAGEVELRYRCEVQVTTRRPASEAPRRT